MGTHIMDARGLNQILDAETMDDLIGEYDSIPKHSAKLSEFDPLTKSKNRYVNVLPNPPTMVSLEKIGNDNATTYINANWVSGFGNKKRRFIATQGPIASTIEDFWRMVWEKSVEVLVMTTGLMEGGRVKCNRYWPREDQGEVEHGNFKITLTDSVDCGDHIQATMDVTNKKVKETRRIKHFWFTGWPDHGVPTSSASVIEFLRAVRQTTSRSEAPIVVHCSAGIGRTGTFMAIDIGMQELQNEWRVTDIHRIVTNMREERGGSVQTFVQYKFIYQALRDYVTPGLAHSMFGSNLPRTIQLTKTRENPYFGFTLRGSYPPFFVEVEAGSLTALKGGKIGDHVVKVNENDTSQQTHKEVVKQIQQSGDSLTLTLISKTPY